LKQLRDSGQKFPIYGNNGVAEGGFENLGKLGFQRIEGVKAEK
jgi:hypothetical protein